MLRVDFKLPVRGFKSIACKGISVDPMDETVFLIQFGNSRIITTPLNNIKHVSECIRKSP